MSAQDFESVLSSLYAVSQSFADTDDFANRVRIRAKRRRALRVAVIGAIGAIGGSVTLYVGLETGIFDLLLSAAIKLTQLLRGGNGAWLGVLTLAVFALPATQRAIDPHRKG